MKTYLLYKHGKLVGEYKGKNRAIVRMGCSSWKIDKLLKTGKEDKKGWSIDESIN